MKQKNRQPLKLRTSGGSVVAPCAFICLLIVLLAELGTDAPGVLPRLGYVFFVEPFRSTVGGGAAVPVLVFGAWLGVAALILKARRESHQARPALLVLLPAVAVAGFNALFDVGTAAPAVQPAAVVTLIGVLLYEVAFACRWSRLGLAFTSFVACAAYGLHTALGLWGALVAATAMLAAELIWSGGEMNLLGSTSALRDREYGYR